MMGYDGLAGRTVMPSAPPYYRRIMDDIRARIASGEWPPGYKLPTTELLALEYKARFGASSMSTVRTAIGYLIEAGVLNGHQGVGVFVAERTT